MTTEAEAVLYDGRTSRPIDAVVRIREQGVLEVDADGERFLWPLEDKDLQWERSRALLRLSFGHHPRKVLIVREAAFIRSFADHMQRAGRRGVYDRVLSLARGGPLLFFLGTVVVLVLGYLYAIPWGAEHLTLLLPRSLDTRSGNAVYDVMSDELDLDSARSTALQRFGDQLQLSPHYTLQYHVVHDDQVNAFALPGGHIVVFTGILDKLERPEELAALLAHEATHVEDRHSMRMLVRQASSYVFLSLLLGDVNGVVAVVAQNADNIRNLSYSRDLESKADLEGMQHLVANGVDPHGMVDLLKLLREEASDVPQGVSFLSSHPLTAQRIADAEREAGTMEVPTSGYRDLDDVFGAVRSLP